MFRAFGGFEFSLPWWSERRAGANKGDGGQDTKEAVTSVPVKGNERKRWDTESVEAWRATRDGWLGWEAAMGCEV
jgi:hypothetical protein